MQTIKKHYVLTIIILVILIFGSLAIFHNRKHYSLADFGVPPLLKADCSYLKNTNTNSAVTIAFNAPNVSVMRDKIKTLITKYNGHITNDSFNSYSYPTQTPSNYPSPTPIVSNFSQDSANIIVTFDKSQTDFLAELADLVKNSGGVNTNYNYTDGSQPQSGGYSSYTSCISMMQSVSADVLQLEVFTKALQEEHDPANISLLSQSISNTKNNLQNDVNNMNGFFTTSDKPSVNISVNTLQK